jgi:hypothetical protein
MLKTETDFSLQPKMKTAAGQRPFIRPFQVRFASEEISFIRAGISIF